MQSGNNGCQCDDCHCQATSDPEPLSQPPSSEGPRFDAPVALVATLTLHHDVDQATAASFADRPLILSRPVRERYCVWVI
jgi:hypothetical protein